MSTATRRTSQKNKSNVNKPTLDVQHNNFMQKLQDVQVEKDVCIKNLANTDTEIRELENNIVSIDDYSERELYITRLIRLKDTKLKLQEEIVVMNDRYSIDKYFMNAANILFQYYDILENGNNVDAEEGDDVMVVNQQIPSPNQHVTHAPAKPVPGILKYFSPTVADMVDTSNGNDGNKSALLIPEVLATPMHRRGEPVEKTRGSLLEQYLQIVNEDHVMDMSSYQTNGPHEACNFCGAKSLMTLVNDGCIYCSTCHAVEYIVIDHDKPSYRDPPKEVSFYAYKRTNHLNEWLSQIQGKETTEIPEEVYDRILVEIKKQKINNMAQITPKKIREILRKLQINKYEHIPHIVSRLTGRPMVQMPPELEEKLRSMFKQVQTPFLKYSPASRKNFLSYSYTLHKMLQLLGKDEFLNLFTLLRARDKLYAQDCIWKQICEELGWQFIPSM
jgi:hypothetical protein